MAQKSLISSLNHVKELDGDLLARDQGIDVDFDELRHHGGLEDGRVELRLDGEVGR